MNPSLWSLKAGQTCEVAWMVIMYPLIQSIFTWAAPAPSWYSFHRYPC